MFHRIRRAASAVALFSCAATAAQAQMTPPALSFAPFRAGDRYFFTADSGTLYVRDEANGLTKALLPPNSYGTVAPSRNGKYLAYTLPAPTGASSRQIHIRDVDTRRDLSEVLENGAISNAPWTDNHKGFFYAREDPNEHRQRVYYHRVGTPQSRDEPLYSRQDELDWRYDIRVSDDGQYAVYTISHPQDNHTRIYFIDLDNPGKPSLNAPVVKLIDDFGARYDFIDNGGSSFFLATTRTAPLGRVVLANTDNTRQEQWPVVIPESTDTLRYAHTAGDEYVIAVYSNGTRVDARLYTPPSVNEMRAEARRRQDSVRKATGDTVDGRNDRPRTRGTMGGNRDPYYGRDRGMPVSGFRLDQEGAIPIPSGATLLGMNSIADKEEVYYAVKLADGTVRFYEYNVKKGTNTLFNSSTTTVRR